MIGAQIMWKKGAVRLLMGLGHFCCIQTNLRIFDLDICYGFRALHIVILLPDVSVCVNFMQFLAHQTLVWMGYYCTIAVVAAEDF